MINILTDETVKITQENQNDWSPAWSPDGHYLAFYSDRTSGKNAELWLRNIETRKERRVTDLRVMWGPIQWTADSRHVFVLAYPEGITPQQLADRIYPSKLSGTESGAGSAPTMKLYESNPTVRTQSRGSSDPWNLDRHLADLALIDVANGKVQRISSGERIGAYWISPDANQIAYSVPLRFEKAGSQQILFDLEVFDRITGMTRVVAPQIRLGYDGERVEWLPDGNGLSFRSDGPDGTGDVYVVTLSNGITRRITEVAGSTLRKVRESDLLWDAAGKHAYFLHGGEFWQSTVDDQKAVKLQSMTNHSLLGIVQRGDQIWSPDGGRSAVVFGRNDLTKQYGFYRIDLVNGKTTSLLEESKSFGAQRGNAVSPDGEHLIYLTEDAQHAPDLWIADNTFHNLRRLTHINPELDRYEMGAAKLIEWRADSGQQIQGALLLPTGYREGQRYPLLVWVYGSTLLSMSDSVNTFGLQPFVGPGTMQAFATRGYAVLLPDTPLNSDAPLTDIFKNVMPAVDKVVEMGIADPNRLGVMGHSYGGFSTLALITQTSRFKAAIMGDGFGDWMGNYGSMRADGGAYGTAVSEMTLGGTPWQFRNRYIENSPVFYLDKVSTPLFIFHGTEDRAVPPFLSDQIFVGLRRLGKAVVYAKYHGEDHSPMEWKYANQLDLLNRMIGWFDDHLKKPASSSNSNP